jgi:hypothetical protein
MWRARNFPVTPRAYAASDRGGEEVLVMTGRSTGADLVTRVRLFLGSYAPLFALLALRFQSRWLSWGLAVLAGLLFADMVRLAVFIPRRVNADVHTVLTVEDQGSQVAGYLATYLLPFLAVTEPSTRDLLAYALYLVVVGVVTVRSNLTHINPTLYLLGYRLVSLTTTEGFAGYAAVRTPPAPGEHLRANHLGRHVLVEVR